MKTISERLRHARTTARLERGERKMTQTELARRCGCAQTTIASIEVRNRGSSMIPRIAYELGVSPLWLAEGRGPMRPDGDIPKRQHVEKSNNILPLPNTTGLSDSAQSNVTLDGGSRRVPLVTLEKAGMLDKTSPCFGGEYAKEWLPVMRDVGRRVVAVRVKGDSMTAQAGKSYPDGVVVIVDFDRIFPVSNDRVLATLETGETVFRSYINEGGEAWLRPLNPQYPATRSGFKIIGTVIARYESEI